MPAGDAIEVIPDDLVVHAGRLLHIAQSRVDIDRLLGWPAPVIEFLVVLRASDL